MRNIGYYIDYIEALGSLWLLVNSLRKGSVIFRDWRHQGQAILGIVGIAVGGLSLFGPEALHATREARMYFMVKGFLVGAFAGIFISLCLAGWFKDILSKNWGTTEES